MGDLVRTGASLERNLLTKVNVVIELSNEMALSVSTLGAFRRQRGNSHESGDLQLPANDETHRKKTSP